MKTFLLLLLLAVQFSFSFAEDRTDCNRILSAPIHKSLQDLAAFRVELDLRKVEGISWAMTSLLEAQYFLKQSEVLATFQKRGGSAMQFHQALSDEISKYQGRQLSPIEIQQRQMDAALTSVKTIGVLPGGRFKHTQVTLPNGETVVLGGTHDFVNPVLGVTTVDAVKRSIRSFDQTRLNSIFPMAFAQSNDQVLFVGGNWRDVNASVFQVNLLEGSSKFLGLLKRNRSKFTARLIDDDVYVTGEGVTEIFNTKTNESEFTSVVYDNLYGDQTSILLDGTVVQTGGKRQFSDRQVFSTITIVRPNGEKIVNPEHLNDSRYDHSQIVMRDETILVVGGTQTGKTLSSVELIDLLTGEVRMIGHLIEPRSETKLTLLPDGRVLVVGGIGADARPSGLIEVIDAVEDTIYPVGILAEPRANHAQSLISADEVLVSGGLGVSAVKTLGIEVIKVGSK